MNTKTSPKINRNAMLGKIHVAKKHLAIDDETLREIAFNFGSPPVRSLSQQTSEGLESIIKHLEKMGFQRSRPARAGRKPEATPERQAQLDKIDALCADSRLSINYAHGIARRMYQVERLEWCTHQQLRGVIAALTKRVERQAEGAQT